MGSIGAIVLITLYIFGFFIGWKMYLSIASPRKYGPHNLSVNDLTYIQRMLNLVLLGVILIYLWKLDGYGLLGSAILPRREMALLTRQDFILSISDTVILTVFIYYTAVLVHYNIARTFFYKCALIICLLISITSISLSSLMVVLISQLFFIDKTKPISRYLLLLMIPGFLLSVIWKPLASYFLFGSNLISIEDLSMPSEFTTWVTIYTNISSDMYGLFNSQYGASYLQTLKSLILPFSEATALSVSYIETYEPIVYESGGGRGFSFFLEAYINFGYIGVFIIGVVVGLLFCQSSFGISRGVVPLFIYILLCTVVFKLFRSESQALLKNLIWLQIIPGLLLHGALSLFLQLVPRRVFRSFAH